MFTRVSFICFLFLSSNVLLWGQSDEYLEGIHSYYDDAMHQWDILSNENEGIIEMTWVNKNDLSEWTYELGDRSGILRTIWPGDFSRWELKSFDGNDVSFSVKWRGDVTEWMITDGDIQVTFKTKYGSNLNEWELQSKKYGDFFMYTEYEDDPRDWIIEDYFDEDLPIEFGVVCSFIPIFVILNR